MSWGRKYLLMMAACVIALECSSAGQDTAFNKVVDRVVASESRLLENLQQYSPVVETYIQNMRPDKELGATPSGDTYFLGRVRFERGEIQYRSYIGEARFEKRQFDRFMRFYSISFLPKGFAQMLVPDDKSFDQAHYDFTFVRREFLGEIKCLLIEVSPRHNAGAGRFRGRIWVEDQDYTIVRFNGTYTGGSRFTSYLHFDSWRTNLQPGLWLPAYVYSEESDKPMTLGRDVRLKSQTRIWGYASSGGQKESEFSEITVETPEVRDESSDGQDLSPVLASREWERQAEENVMERLEKANLLAPSGEVDKVLETVINNLEITNKLDIQPPLRARVMLTLPMESFTIGHTIVLSRGLLDVLPDEASLAAVIAHEMSHILLGHRLDTRYAFADRLLFPNEKSFKLIRLSHPEAEEHAADAKAMELLQNSPYSQKLGNAGLFLREVSLQKKNLPNLLQAHLGNTLTIGGKVRSDALMASAPSLEIRDVDQIAALPLGSRIKLDPWTDSVAMAKYPKVPLLSAREKMPFEVTPVFPFLSRVEAPLKASVTGQ